MFLVNMLDKGIYLIYRYIKVVSSIAILLKSGCKKNDIAMYSAHNDRNFVVT